MQQNPEGMPVKGPPKEPRADGSAGLPALDPIMVFERLDLGVIHLDRNLRLTYINPSAAAMLNRQGQGPDCPFIGDIFSGRADPVSLDKFGRALEETAPLSFELDCCEPARRLFFRCLPSPQGLTVFLEDITGKRTGGDEPQEKVQTRAEDLMDAQRVLQEQKEMLRTVFDHAPVMICLSDPAGDIRLINTEMERVLGWSREDLRHVDFMAACYPDPSYRMEAREYMTGAKPGWCEFRMVTRSGNTVTASWAAVRLPDGSCAGIGINVGERRKMEQNLLRLATAIDQAGEGIVFFSTDWVIEYVNPAFERISGYGRQEITGRRLVFSEDYFAGDNWGEIVSRVEREGTAWRGRRVRRRKSGELIEISLTVAPVFSESGKVANYVAVVLDVTREAKLRQQFAQVQKLEAIGTLAGGIAHDLKNIFTPILLNTETLLEKAGADDPGCPILEEILQAARLGIDLVNHILTFSRQVPQEKKPIPVSPLVRETLSFLRATLPLTIDILPRLDTGDSFILGDSIRIKQVLMNLASNARYAMREHGGLLEVNVSCVDIDEQTATRISPDLTPGSYVQIVVSDTGEGMDETLIERIFDPFFTTKNQGEGMGMGLAVVHGIVKDHKGAVTVWSQRGKGSAFKVLLPRLEKESILPA